MLDSAVDNWLCSIETVLSSVEIFLEATIPRKVPNIASAPITKIKIFFIIFWMIALVC